LKCTSQLVQILISISNIKIGGFKVKSQGLQGNAISVSLEALSKACCLEFAMRLANKITECRLCV